MLNKIKRKLNLLDVHTLEVIKKSVPATIVKVLGMIVGLFVSVFLGHALGAKGLGIINLANLIASILIILSLLGTPQLLVKEIAIAYQKKDWKHISDYLFSAFRLNGGMAILLSGLFIILTPWLAENFFHDPELKIPMIITLSVMIFQVLSRIYASGLNGFRRIWQSNLVNESLSIIVAGLILFIMWATRMHVTIIIAAIAYAVGRITVTTTVGMYWRVLYKERVKRPQVVPNLVKKALPFLMVSATGIIASNVDGVMIGWLGNAKEVGLYSVAARLAMLTIFFLQITNSVISPKLAALYAERKIAEMNKMVQSVTAGLVIVALVPLLFFIFYGDPLLSIWGEEFKSAYWILVVLSIGQFFNIGTGASGLILVMCGFERLQAWISIVSVLMNIVICYVLIPVYGALGAAISTAISVFLENMTKVILGKTKVGIMTIPFSVFSKQ